MNRRIARGAAVLASSFLLAGSALTVAPGLTAVAGAACFDPQDAGAAAKGANARAHDTRQITAKQQRGIEARTAKILAAKRAARTGGTAAAATSYSKSSIPVYVHVMTSTSGAGNVTDTQIAQQITVLNQTYGGQDVNSPGKTNTGIGFYLAGANRIANNTWHADRQSTKYRAATRQGDKNALNIWLVDFNYLGIATFPWDYAANPKIDGIRVQYSSLPGGSATNYNLGETATHEAGHWLGLYHTFQGGCAAPGDSVSDTASQASPSSGCPTGRDSCAGGGLDPIHNYMDYSYDSCYYEFTPGQSTRMDQMWTAYRK